ncbi:hydroxymethylglutaryl-CoA synthase [Candidatus Woesearchaeota archaeon]|nr:hydroxymethylglutaryl-CoA synthase [Candidatus Woesearchaeota archaeon]
MTGIIGWGAYIPHYRIKAEEIAKAQGQDADTIKSGLRIEEKSVPGIDEDSATIAVEAAKNALKRANILPTEIGAIYLGSESHPYAVKPTGTIVAQAIGMSNNYTTADLEFACKAGTAALQIIYAMVKSDMIRYGLAGGIDTAQAAPGDPLEYTAAAGGAVFILGRENIVAEIKDTVSFTSDTPDFWRRAYQKYPSHGGAFTGEPAYFKHIINATELLLKKVNKKPTDYTYAIFHQPNGKFPVRVAKKLGFNNEQILPGLLVPKIGNTYSGSSILGLAAVLDIAKPGDTILVTSYGSGAGSDSFDIEVTDQILRIRNKSQSVQDYIDNIKYIDYATYLKYTKK